MQRFETVKIKIEKLSTKIEKLESLTLSDTQCLRPDNELSQPRWYDTIFVTIAENLVNIEEIYIKLEYGAFYWHENIILILSSIC